MLAEAAHRYLAAGLSVLPAKREGEQKRVALRAWKPYQARLPTEMEVRAWFANNHAALCLVCGAVSGGLEMIDFDLGGEAFPAWRDLVGDSTLELLDRLVIESTPSGGRHVIYRCEAKVCGNLKLAQRRLAVPDGEPIVVAAKTFVPRRQPDGSWSVLLTLIETRGEGGIFLCAPSEGYELLQGDLANPPVLTADEREALLAAAWALNEVVPTPEPIPVTGANVARPGDAYAKRGDVRDVLRRHGWTLARGAAPSGDGNEYWRRPGKTDGWSATLKEMSDGRVFYVFSSNADPFEPGKAYGPFGVYALLEHEGDFAAAARALRAEGYGDDAGDDHVDVDLGGIMGQPADAEPNEPQAVDPGPMPDDLLDVPGFIRQVVDHMLITAPYPQPILAFAAALTLQAFLAGRKVRDAADNRTNLYVLALANSGAGKDHPRKVNQRICIEAGLQDCLGDSFASGEGIEDRMFVTPALLFQTDEIDGLMNAINRASDARDESIMNALLKFYTSSNAIYPMRVKAGKQSPGVIDQPSLCMLGTAVPKYYYEALSIRMLNNGFFARLLILEAGRRGRGQTPVDKPIPQAVIDIARWWADFRPGGANANLQQWHPQPALVEATPTAETRLEECRTFADERYEEAEKKDDQAGMAIWARAHEKTRKLALIHAVSSNHQRPQIDESAVEWAWRFVDHQTRRMLFMAGQHVAEGEFDARCKRMLEVLTSWRQRKGEAWMPHWELSRRLKWSDKDIEEVRNTLRGQRRIEYEVPAPPDEATTRPGDLYILGNHRLLCGDSSNPADVDRLLDGQPVHLVNTDPPYNVKLEPRSNNAIAAGLSSFGEHGLMHHQSFDLHRAEKKRSESKEGRREAEAKRTASKYHGFDVATGGQSGKATHKQMRAKDRPLANDFVSDDEFDKMLRAWFGNIARVLLPGHIAYIWGGYANCGNYPPALKACGLYFSQAIIWDKEHPVLTRKDFMGAHEWCFYCWREGAAHRFFGPNNVTDLWHVKKINPNAMIHLTEKPVELAVRAMQYSSLAGENVLDLFGGSGSTLIAAEQTGRRAFLMELDPLYCDIIVQRWEKFTGRKAARKSVGKEEFTSAAG